MKIKQTLAATIAIVASLSVVAAPAFAGGTNTHSYSGKSQGYWGGKWWDNNATGHTIYLKNPSGCTTTRTGTKSVTYRMHKLNGVLPATSLGDREFLCNSTANRTFLGPSGNHEYQWQLVGINGQGSGGTAAASNVTATY